MSGTKNLSSSVARRGPRRHARGNRAGRGVISPAPRGTWRHSLVDGGDPPDAVFCFSDSLALGALRAAHDDGLRVPDDLAVVGFDDAEDGRYSVPSLTSVSPDKRWIAHTAFTRIARRLAGEDMPPETLVAPFRLVVRESSGG